ncbi:MAG: hypothetical protein RI947_777 [Candidatus Parcubacteria bacterium]|jgi:hypothetical protein
MKSTKIIPQIAIASAVLSLLSILSLHFLSAELDPTWHMVSEYAYGQHGWMLSIFFFCWAVSYWFTSFTLLSLPGKWIYKLGVFLIFISGVGALMGALYDVRQPLHGLAFAIGVPFVPFVAPFITRHLQKKFKLTDCYASYLSHATWISFILMAGTMMSFISQMQKVGALNMDKPQLLTSLPEGVTSIIGISNRSLVFAYIAWLIAINLMVMRLRKKGK